MKPVGQTSVERVQPAADPTVVSSDRWVVDDVVARASLESLSEASSSFDTRD